MMRKWIGAFVVMWLLSGCLKTDETQYYTDIYWFRNATVVAGIDTSSHQSFILPISVFRTAGLVYETDSVAFEVLTSETTAATPEVYELESNVVRFVDADTVRSEIRMKVHSGGLMQNDTVALRLIYDHPSSTAALRRHDRISVVLMPVAPTPEPEPDPEPDSGTETDPSTDEDPDSDDGTGSDADAGEDNDTTTDASTETDAEMEADGEGEPAADSLATVSIRDSF